MKVETYLFGAVEIDPERVITFPNGLLGFETSKHFILAHEEGTGEVNSFTLQSADDPFLAFQVAEPAVLGFSYELALTEEEATVLSSPSTDEVAVMLLLFKQESGIKGVAPHLRAPLVINTKTRIGIQKVMERVNQSVVLSNLISPV